MVEQETIAQLLTPFNATITAIGGTPMQGVNITHPDQIIPIYDVNCQQDKAVQYNNSQAISGIHHPVFNPGSEINIRSCLFVNNDEWLIPGMYPQNMDFNNLGSVIKQWQSTSDLELFKAKHPYIDTNIHKHFLYLQEELTQLKKMVKDNNNIITQQQRIEGKQIAQNYYQFMSLHGNLYGEIGGQNAQQYANLALDVVKDQGIFGNMANIHLRTQAVFEGKIRAELPVMTDKLIIGLAGADMDCRVNEVAKNLGEGGLPHVCNPRAIRDYHEEQFNLQQLSIDCWGGEIFNKLFGEGSWLPLMIPQEAPKTISKLPIEFLGAMFDPNSNRVLQAGMHTLKIYLQI